MAQTFQVTYYKYLKCLTSKEAKELFNPVQEEVMRSNGTTNINKENISSIRRMANAKALLKMELLDLEELKQDGA